MRNRLQKLRKQRHWSQSDLARALGVSRQAVNGFESSKFDPSLEMAFKIAQVFNVAIEDVFISETQRPMPTLLERVTKTLGFEFGFERFTDEAIQAIEAARAEAGRSPNSRVEPEHLLTGLLADTQTPAARLLQAHGMPPKSEKAVEKQQSTRSLKFSAHGQFVLELALQIVRLNGSKSIGTEHLLWGLLKLVEAEPATYRQLFQATDLVALNQDLTAMLSA